MTNFSNSVGIDTLFKYCEYFKGEPLEVFKHILRINWYNKNKKRTAMTGKIEDKYIVFLN